MDSQIFSLVVSHSNLLVLLISGVILIYNADKNSILYGIANIFMGFYALIATLTSTTELSIPILLTISFCEQFGILFMGYFFLNFFYADTKSMKIINWLFMSMLFLIFSLTIYMVYFRFPTRWYMFFPLNVIVTLFFFTIMTLFLIKMIGILQNMRKIRDISPTSPEFYFYLIYSGMFCIIISIILHIAFLMAPGDLILSIGTILATIGLWKIGKRDSSLNFASFVKQLKNEIIIREKNFLTLFESSVDPIFELNNEGILLSGNKSFELIVERRIQEIRNKKIDSLIDSDDVPLIYSAISRIQKNQTNAYIEFRLHSRNVILSANLTPFQTINGKIESIIVTTRDITLIKIKQMELESMLDERTKDLKQTVDLLKVSLNEIETISNAKTDFLANMSHELRTPLNSIIGFSELLIDLIPGPLNPDQQELIKNIHSGGQFLLSLVNDILDLTRIERGNLTLSVDYFMASDILNDSIRFIHNKAVKKQIKVESAIKPHDFSIFGDKMHLKQVLINLIDNAVKFTPESGLVSISMEDNPNEWKIIVKDTGIGIKESDRSKLFKIFQQIENPVTKTHGGTGIGLYYSKKIVELHHGVIELTSFVGEGTTVIVSIPK
jgi:PAS domain S-box-containing protein